MAAVAVREIVPPAHKDPTIMNPAASPDHRAERFYSAGRLCGPGQMVRFQDGSLWQEQQLYAKAIELNPSLAPAHHNLALSLREKERVLIHGVEWSRVQLYLKAIQLDPSFAPSHVNLASLLGPEDTVSIGAGPPQDRCSLLLQAIHADPSCAMAYANLSIMLPPGSTVQLPSGSTVSATSLMATAHQLDRTCVPCVVQGGSFMSPQRLPPVLAGSVTLSPGLLTPQKLPRPTMGRRGSGPLPSLLGSTATTPANTKPGSQPATVVQSLSSAMHEAADEQAAQSEV